MILSADTDEIGIIFNAPVDQCGKTLPPTQADLVFLNDFTSCFDFKRIIDANGLSLALDNPVLFNEAQKKRLLAFINKYSSAFPRMKALPKALEKIPLDSYVVVANSSCRHDQVFMADMINRLLVMKGKNPLGKEFSEFLDLYEAHHFGTPRMRYIGKANKAERVCRWCGRSMPEVTFLKKAHAISESLGNKTVILCDECDECNQRYGDTIEPSATTYFQFENTLFGVHGKDGIPKIKKSDHSFLFNDGKNVYRIAAEGECVGDMPPERIYIQSPNQIVDQDIYRCFCKYALSVMPDAVFCRYKWLIPWLDKQMDFVRVPLILTYHHFNLNPETGDKTEQPVLNLYIRKFADDSRPSLIGEFHHTIRTHIFIVPLNEDELEKFSSKDICLGFWKSLPFIKESSWNGILDLSSTHPHDYGCNIHFKLRSQQNGIETSNDCSRD